MTDSKVNFEAAAMRALSRPTMLAIDIGKSAAPLPTEGVATVVEFVRGQPAVIMPGWPKALLLRQSPAMIVAVLAGDNGPNLNRLTKWLRESGTDPLPQVYSWAKGKEQRALAAATAELKRLAAEGLTAYSETAQQARRLRASNAELRYRFALAESALQRRDAVPFTLAFSNEPVAEPSPYDVLNESAAGVSQILPVASGGVAAIALHFGAADISGGTLELTLASLEDAQLLERWSITSTEIAAGWNIFGLSRTLSGQDRTLKLQISKSGDERLPPLSLGNGQPIPDFQIRDLATQQAAMPRSLALQVWRGLPGTRLSSSIEAHMPVRRNASTGGFTERPVAALSLRSVELANPEAVSFDFKPVWAPPGENTATCHPPSHGVTLGQLPHAAPGEAIKISASIGIGNERSQEVDFGMVVTDHPARALEILQGGSSPLPHEAFSGWARITSKQARRISAFCDVSDDARNVFIATRMTHPGDNSYAQARFKDFTIMVRG